MFRLDKVLSVGGYEDVKFFEDYFEWPRLWPFVLGLLVRILYLLVHQ